MNKELVVLLEGTRLSNGKEANVLLPDIYDGLTTQTTVNLVNEDGELIGRAYLQEVEVLRFRDLFDDDFTFLSHPEMTNRVDAALMLDSVSPSFHEGSVVSFLSFIVTYLESGSVYVDREYNSDLDYEPELEDAVYE